MPSALFIDANLIVLLVVGSVGHDLISRHRGIRTFVVDWTSSFNMICLTMQVDQSAVSSFGQGVRKGFSL